MKKQFFIILALILCYSALVLLIGEVIRNFLQPYGLWGLVVTFVIVLILLFSGFYVLINIIEYAKTRKIWKRRYKEWLKWNRN